MGWLSRKPQSRFPADMLRRLETLGRYELDKFESDLEPPVVIATCIQPFWEDSQANKDGFLADLRAIVATDTGGLATYGASCLVWELYSRHDTADAVAILDSAVRFKTEADYPPSTFKGYETTRLWELREH